MSSPDPLEERAAVIKGRLSQICRSEFAFARRPTDCNTAMIWQKVVRLDRVLLIEDFRRFLSFLVRRRFFILIKKNTVLRVNFASNVQGSIGNLLGSFPWLREDENP
jgi:hypothetical protein